MGRAITMENEIEKLQVQIKRIDAALAKVIDVVDSMENKGQRTTHVDLADGADKYVKEKVKSKKSNEKTKQSKKD